MRLLDRYLLRELLIWLAFFFAGFLLLWTAFELSLDLHKLQEAHLRAKEVVEYSIYSIPEFMPIAMPVSLLLALLYSLIRVRVWPWLRRVRATRVARATAPTSTLGAV